MLSIKRDHELFRFLSTPPQQQNIPPQSFVTTVRKAESKGLKSSRKRKSSIAFGDIIHNNESPEDYAKRITHRDVERRRRREMSILYQSLRSLLPDEYLLKKRSVSDQVHGTVNYIRHLKTRVEDLINKRGELKNLMNLGKNSSSCIGSDISVSQGKTSVAVRSSATGMQVILKTGLEKGLPLSKLLSALNNEGMAVISCISTRANEWQIHVIESEIDEGRSVDQTMLQKRLRDLVYNL